MPISAGEVEAVLTARDNMSAAIELVTQRITDLQNKIQSLGATSGPEFDKLNEKLYGAQLQLVNLNQAAINASSGMDETGGSTARAYTEMDRMDGIATRLVERLLIFYALRASFNFVEGLFTGAAALEELSAQTDMSLGKLQELQYASEQTDIKFTTVTSAIDSFSKKLAEMKPATVDALSNLHIGLDQIFSLNPDQRFDLVATAIANLPTHIQRSAAEIALFGTDTIDPLIKNLKALEAQAESAGAVLGDDSVKRLAEADKAFKELGNTLKILAAGFITAEQAVAQFIATPLFLDGSIWQKIVVISGMMRDPGALAQLAFNAATGGGGYDLKLPPQTPQGKAVTPGGGPPDMPLYGAAYVEQVREQSMAVKDLTIQQEDEVRELQALDEWNADNAAKIGLTSEQYRQLTKDAQERSKVENQIESDEKRWQAEQAAALLEETKLWDMVGATVGTSFDQQVAAIDKWAQDLEARFQKSKADTDDFYTALYVAWKSKLSAIAVDTKALTDAATNDSKTGLQQIADKAYNTFQVALQHVGEWSDGTIQKFQTTYEAAQKAADAWGSDNATWIDGLVAKQKQLQDAIDATAAKQQAAASFFLTPSQLGFVNPFIPGSTGYLPPGRAQGGPVSAGQPYVINEDTPNSEIFIPTTSGYVSPPGVGSMGGITVTPTMIFQSLVPTDPRTVEYVRQAADSAIIGSLRNLVRMSRA